MLITFPMCMCVYLKKNACMHLQTHVGLRVYVTYMSVRVHVCVEVSVEERWKGDRCIQWQSHEE